MSAGDRGWEGKGEGAEVESEQGSGMFGKRRLAALAAVVALAAWRARSVARWRLWA